MAVERLEQNINFDLGDPFIILYGMGVLDSFITKNYLVYDIESALWELLQEQGFERIVFYSPTRGIYFLDANSRDLSRPQTGRDFRPPSEGKTGSSTMKRLSGGPMGNRMIFQAPQESASPASDDAPPMDDAHAIRLLNTIMASRGYFVNRRDENGPRSAVVIMQSETLKRRSEVPRLLEGRMGEWARFSSMNRNVCIWQFAAYQYQQLCEAVNMLDLPELNTYIQIRNSQQSGSAQYNVVHINTPDRAEMERLVYYARLMYDVRVDWRTREKLLDWMVAEGVGAGEWLTKFSNVGRIDLETARQRRWISVDGDDRSAEERLNALLGLQPVKERVNELVAFVEEEMRRR